MRQIKLVIVLLLLAIISQEINVYALTEPEYKEIYSDIKKTTNLEEKYIEILHGLTNYTDNKHSYPIHIKLFDTELQSAPFSHDYESSIYCIDDVLYSICYDISSLMSQRYMYNRGMYQVYFDTLNYNTKLDLVFYEALLLYSGEKEYNVDKFITVYMQIIDSKQSLSDTEYYQLFSNIGIVNSIRVYYIITALQYDYCITNNMNSVNASDSILLPYEPNVTSRENMMLASMSLVGKVRYTWGGGHGIVYDLDCINPYWIAWNDIYNNSEYKYSCIRPSGSWCIIHGQSDGLCADTENIMSLEEYINIRSNILNLDEKYINLLSNINFQNGLPYHNMDGLDCSGYVSWVYNQITDKYNVDSTAINFANVGCLESIPYGEIMLPGDVFAWATHVVLIVGKVDKDGTVYVTLEQTPNQTKFGVLHYENAKYSNIETAKQIAKEANQLFGGIYDEKESPHVYCIDTVKYYDYNTVHNKPIEDNIDTTIEVVEDTNTELVENSEDNASEQDIREYMFIGRYKHKFEDENTIIEEYNSKLKNMYAKDIIQYTLDRTLISYVVGYDLYESNLFDKTTISTKY